MSHLKDIMKIHEKDIDLVVFTTKKEEAGINTIYDPQLDKEVFQVFVHQVFPMRTTESWEFSTFREARNFAASKFKTWEMLVWDHGVNRPCGKDNCGGGNCSTKKEGEGGCGGGCSTCGAAKEFDELLEESA